MNESILDEFDDGSVEYRLGATRKLLHGGCCGTTNLGKHCRRNAVMIVDDKAYCQWHVPANSPCRTEP